ncbi:uncharacterized protein FSUBG_2191 [Fusarium subglutinans]|uniref:Uncharacterized protein n=1 Tax=Gibberella subglutinans TaxID=42677 RepID=A0A8H5QAP3_GIBSU|nr:uncharacterized protein FSUBG_2191 [Fusarium subglutinans]KAF5611754.1 hypothetical protein FSUBG_2191 [Fusarium subglutinans]
MTLDLNLDALSAADGFLSGLLFLDVTRLNATQWPNTNSLVPRPQSLESWKCMGDIRAILHGYWCQMMNGLPSLGPMNINDTLATLTSPTTFYEAAVLSFRNTLTGHPPHTLGEIVALCILSYATSSYLSNKGSLSTNDASPCIDQWRDSISDRDHRQAFTHIMEALYPGTANLNPTPGPSQHMAEYSEPFGFTYQDAPFGMSSHQDNLIEDDFLNYLANYGGDPVPDYFALGAESTNQMVQRHCAESYRTRPTGAERPSLRDLQGSAVITQLVYFLEECGELPQILSGRGATTKYANCPVNHLTPRVDEGVKSCIQRMRQTELSLDTTFSAIISVVDRFIQLGYLRTTEDVQEYMLIVGKAVCEVLPIGSEYTRGDFTRYAKKRPSAAHYRVRSSKGYGGAYDLAFTDSRTGRDSLSGPEPSAGTASANATMVIDGLLASLIYLDETNSSATHVLSTKPQSLMRWEAILDFRFKIQRYWQSLVDITQKGDLPGLHTLLESFPTSAHLYETAIFTFRNTLTGSESDDLDGIFALYSLSYLALRHSQKMGKPDADNIFRDINIWRDLIGNPQHRQLFDEIIQRLWNDMTASSFQKKNRTPIPNWGSTPIGSHEHLDKLHRQSQGSMDILSGHGATAKGPYPDVPMAIKNFTQALRRHDPFEDPSARGILAIVDRFVNLNYFRNIDKVRDYTIIVGKEILPSGQAFAKVCKAVYSPTDMTKTPQVARRQHPVCARDRKLCVSYLKDAMTVDKLTGKQLQKKSTMPPLQRNVHTEDQYETTHWQETCKLPYMRYADGVCE